VASAYDVTQFQWAVLSPPDAMNQRQAQNKNLFAFDFGGALLV
jgi:hypothetical protein